MNRFSLILTVFFVFSLHNSVSAEVYVGGGAGLSKIDTGVSATTGTASLDEEDIGYKGIVGYKFIKYLALEAQYVDFGEASLTGNNGDTFQLDGSVFQFTANNVNLKLSGKSIGASIVGIIPINETFAVFGKLGFHRWDVDASATSDAGNASISADGTDPTVGLGISVNFNDTIGIRGELERFRMDDEDVDLLSASLIFSF